MIDFQGDNGYTIDDLINLIAFLRSEEGCPWDRVQTHESIRRNFIEEAYEVAEAIDTGSISALREELGDVLVQVVFHASIEQDKGNFNFGDVVETVCKKMIFRHPGLFGGEGKDLNWEEVKRLEKNQKTVKDSLEGVARSLPALWRAEKLLDKAELAGFSKVLDTIGPDKLTENAKILRETAEFDKGIYEILGDSMLVCVNIARSHDLDPEEVLNAAADRFIKEVGREEEKGL